MARNHSPTPGDKQTTPSLAPSVSSSSETKNVELQPSSKKTIPLYNREFLEHYYATCTCLPSSDKKAETLSTLGIQYHMLYQQGQDAADLDHSISIHREAVDERQSHPRQALHLAFLSGALESRYNYNGNRVDIDEAIQLSQNSLNLTQGDAQERAYLLMQLASNHKSRFNRVGDVADIDLAILTYTEAMTLTPKENPNKVKGHSNFAGALLLRFQRLGAQEDLDRAIANLEKAMNLTPEGHPDQPSGYSNLGFAFQRRFERLDELADLERAISNKERAVNLTPDGHPNKPTLYNNLGNAFSRRFECLDDIADLDRAISNNKNAVNLTLDGHPDKPAWYNNLGGALKLRFERLGDLADLDNAIFYYENAMKLTLDGHPELPIWHNNLGFALQSRFERLGKLVDLERAISSQEIAVNFMPDGHPNKTVCHNNLGRAFQYRFERLGDIADLGRAISNHKNAVKLTPDGHPEKPSRYGNLGVALQHRFERLGDLADLDNAISNNENAVNLRPDGRPGNPVSHNNLGNAFRHRFIRLNDIADLERAIIHYKNAVNITLDGHPGKPSRYTNLGNALQLRFERLGDLTDLDGAICNNENAMNLTPEGAPDKVLMTSNLAYCHFTRFSSLKEDKDLDLAYSLYATATQAGVGYPQRRFDAAVNWARCAKLKNISPLLPFKYAIDQLPRIAWLGIPINEQHSLLKKIGGTVRVAVAAAVEANEYNMAVEWTEQGRSIVWQNLLNLRAPVDDLRAVHPDLASLLQSISQQLDSPISYELEPQTRQETQPQKSYTSLAVQWDETVDQIRKLPNFKSFLKPKPFDIIAPAAHEGSVVILNVAADRCDALALIAGSDGSTSVVSIPLSFSLKQSEKLLLKLTTLLRGIGVRDGETRKPTQQPRSMDTQKAFESILYTLWVAVVKPVLDGLEYQPCASDLPRIWWCTTGPLALLPIHAAGDYNATTFGQKLSDFAVSSYTPTLTAILDSSYPTPSNDFKLLLIAQPAAPNYTTIPKTMNEVERIERIASGIDTVVLTKEQATVERVQQGMRESNWVHLACHGKQDVSKSMDSGLVLFGGTTLKLSTIITEPLPKAEFAFLSACQTAMGDEKLAEESAHLAAGMLLAGYRGVIATMWSIRDEDGPKVAEAIYSRMLKDGKPDRRQAAYALHEAVKELRESGADFLSWVPFIHIVR